MSGAVHRIAICSNETEEIRTSRGALGTATLHGVAETTPDAEPVPIELTALTRNKYDVPLVNPVTVVARDVETPSANTV